MKTMVKFRIGLVIFCLAANSMLVSGVFAQEETREERYRQNLRHWQSLSEEERQVIRARAKSLDREKMYKLREASQKFRQMPPQERQKLRERSERFNRMPPEKRQVLRERYRRFQRLPQEKREELRRRISSGAPGQEFGQPGRHPLPERRIDDRRDSRNAGPGMRQIEDRAGSRPRAR